MCCGDKKKSDFATKYDLSWSGKHGKLKFQRDSSVVISTENQSFYVQCPWKRNKVVSCRRGRELMNLVKAARGQDTTQAMPPASTVVDK